jgi:hypothetical protein
MLTKTRENVSITVERFTLEKDPICAVMGDSISSKNRMVCTFLRTRMFGQEFVCNFLEETLESGPLIVPHTNCPLWRDRNATSESVEY